MNELNTQIRDYFEAIAPPFEVGDLVRDADTSQVVEFVAVPARRSLPWPAVAAALLTLAVVGALPWLLGGGGRSAPAAATRGALEITESVVLDTDHVGTIDIVTDGVTLDCDGHEVRAGPTDVEDDAGILVGDVQGVTVVDCVVSGFDHGVEVTGSRGVLLAGNSISTLKGGIGVHDSVRVELVDNTVRGAGVDGYLFQNMRDSLIRDNTAIENHKNYSFEFGSTGNVIEANAARGGDTGFEVGDAPDNLFRRNTVVGAATWSIEDRSGGNDSSSNQYEDNDCTGAPSTPPGVCDT